MTCIMVGIERTVYLQLAGSAEPHVINAWQLCHAVAGLVHGDATHVAADQLVKVKVHITVAHAAPVPGPLHLHSPGQP